VLPEIPGFVTEHVPPHSLFDVMNNYKYFTSYHPRHFVVSKLQTGGLHAPRSQERIEGKSQASRT